MNVWGRIRANDAASTKLVHTLLAFYLSERSPRDTTRADPVTGGWGGFFRQSVSRSISGTNTPGMAPSPCYGSLTSPVAPACSKKTSACTMMLARTGSAGSATSELVKRAWRGQCSALHLWRCRGMWWLSARKLASWDMIFLPMNPISENVLLAMSHHTLDEYQGHAAPSIATNQCDAKRPAAIKSADLLQSATHLLEPACSPTVRYA